MSVYTKLVWTRLASFVNNASDDNIVTLVEKWGD